MLSEAFDQNVPRNKEECASQEDQSKAAHARHNLYKLLALVNELSNMAPWLRKGETFSSGQTNCPLALYLIDKIGSTLTAFDSV